MLAPGISPSPGSGAMRSDRPNLAEFTLVLLLSVVVALATFASYALAGLR
jgi:hypothetical protein